MQPSQHGADYGFILNTLLETGSFNHEAALKAADVAYSACSKQSREEMTTMERLAYDKFVNQWTKS